MLLSVAACGSEPEQPILIEAANPAYMVTRASTASYYYLRDASKPATSDVAIAFNYEEKDKLGNKLQKPLFVFHFKKDIVNAANFDNLNGSETLELLDRVELQGPVSAQAVLGACKPVIFPKFCELAAADIMRQASAAPSEQQSKPAR